MTDWRRIDPETGMWIEDVVNSERPMLEDGTPDPAYIAEPVPTDAGFYHPRWNGSGWEEGLTPEEIAARQAAATPPEPPLDERNAADIQYLAMMMGVDLDV